ncbi:MAG: rod shape-determining protein MreC [Candidatus Yanofskybacteria bacterium]|nr:rod shape-determining protein MreC [Candidatus Yanofskybacteria bacterium]
MENLKFWKQALFIIVAGLLVFLGFTNIKFESPIARLFNKPSAFLFSRLSSISSFFAELGRIRDLAGENKYLREENTRLLSRIATQLQAEEDNKLLREAMNLPGLSEFKIVDAGTFNVSFGPDGHRLLINKGFADGIRRDSSVVSSSGVLVGRILEVFDSYSVVGVVTDSSFKATIRILETNISGIARGSLHEGIFIDFISQKDEIKEGDIVITNGNDPLPPGFIIGKISHISAEDGNVFKKVQVSPMMSQVNISRVMVLIK